MIYREFLYEKNKKIVASVSAIAIILSSIISVGAATYYDSYDYGSRRNSAATLRAERTGEYYVSSNDYIIGRLKIYPIGKNKRNTKGRVYFKYKNFWGNWKVLDGADSGTITKYATKSKPNEVCASADSSNSYVDCRDTWTSKFEPQFSFYTA